MKNFPLIPFTHYLSLSIYLLSMTFQNSFAQQEECGTTMMMQRTIQEKPELQQIINQGNEYAKKYAREKTTDKNGGNYIIPVVFHIFHDYGDENVSDERIETAIQALNSYFQKSHDAVDEIIPEFEDIAANTQIEFRLAKIDPDGNCTNGITRTASSLTYSGAENVKAVQSWDTKKYLNIWSVKRVAGGITGYAHLPGTAPSPSSEGVVIESLYVSDHKVLVHEVGHFLNLHHTWGPLNPGQASNCNFDDFVDDTPNTIGPDGCNLGAHNCNSLDMTQNYMTYGNCRLAFTEGQKTRMHATLESSIGSRNKLWQEANLIATGTNDGYITQDCPLRLDFKASKELICPNNTIQFTGSYFNTDTVENWNWSFPGGTPSSSTLRNPSVVYENGGQYDVTVSTINDEGTTSFTKENYVTVLDADYGEQLPFFEGIEGNLFPRLDTDTLKEWEIEGAYLISKNAMTSGKASLRFVQAAGVNDTRSLMSPYISFFDKENVQLTFKMAFAVMQQNSSPMALKISASKDCGKNWSEVYSKSKEDLYTNGGEIPSSFFVPNASEWREETASFDGFQNQPAVLILIELVGSSGGVFYMDDLNIDGDKFTSVENIDGQPFSLNIFPNPITRNSIIEMEVIEPTTITLEVVDILGTTLSKKSLGKVSGFVRDNFLTNVRLTDGVYFLKTTANNRSWTKKIIF